nr:hypothetical protein [Candidatus Woesearchaeota archaeon]
MTKTHKFMYLDERGNFKFKNAKEAKVGDRVATLSKLNLDFDFKNNLNLAELFIENLDDRTKKKILIKGQEHFFYTLFRDNLEGIKKNFGSQINIKRLSEYVTIYHLEKLINLGLVKIEDLENGTKLRFMFSKHEFPVNLNLNKGLMRILGYYLAEGYSRSNKQVSQICFRVCEKDLQNDLISTIKKVFSLKTNLGEDNSKITICSKLLYHLFNDCFKIGKNAYEKRVPSFVYGLDKDLIIEFISAYLDGDGSIISTKKRNFVAFYSVNRSLLDDISLLLNRFEIFCRYLTTKPRLPGRKVLNIYKLLGREPKKHILNHLIINGIDATNLKRILRLNSRIKSIKLDSLKEMDKRNIKFNNRLIPLQANSDYFTDYVKKVEIIKKKRNSYCVEIDWKSQEDKNILWGEQIINTRCDGDEACVLLLMDGLLNFSRKYLPSHRGTTQDAPLVLTSRLIPSEVDDMIYDLDIASKYPLELYETALNYGSPFDVKVKVYKETLNKPEQYQGLMFTHNTSDINMGVRCSAYKSIPTMIDKVRGQMGLAEKIRAVDESDVARLIIERHFIRDIKGNLRKFGMQGFRCVDCNMKYRRPPLTGNCVKCKGRIIFTVSEGSIVKYLEPSIELAEKYDLPLYLKQTLELTKKRIESVFGKEKEVQRDLVKWFS